MVCLEYCFSLDASDYRIQLSLQLFACFTTQLRVSRARRWSRLWYRVNTGRLLRSLLPIQELLETGERHFLNHKHRPAAVLAVCQ